MSQSNTSSTSHTDQRSTQDIITTILSIHDTQQDDMNQLIDTPTKQHLPTTKQELIILIDTRTIDPSNIDTSMISDMSYLFYISKLNNQEFLSSQNTSSVINTSNRFHKYESLISIPLFDISKSKNVYTSYV